MNARTANANAKKVSVSRQDRDTSSLIQRLRSSRGFVGEFAKLRAFLRRRSRTQLDHRILSRVDPSDIVQETFILARSRLSAFLKVRPMPFRNWIRLLGDQLVIAAHRNHLRSKKRTVNRESNDARSAVMRDRMAISSKTPVDQVAERESSDRLHDLLRRLSLADQQIITLRDIDEMSNIEAAEYLEITPLAASKRHSRALERLRRIALTDAALRDN